MTVTIRQTVLDKFGITDFAAEVDAFCKALAAHQLTKKGEARPQPKHPLIGLAVMRVAADPKTKKPDRFEADYNLIDDRPPPPTLDQKVKQLYGKIAAAEKAAKFKLLSEGRRRLLHFDLNMAMAVDEKDRNVDEKAVIDQYTTLKAAEQTIERQGAVMMAEVDDLTEENVDAWQVREIT